MADNETDAEIAELKTEMTDTNSDYWHSPSEFGAMALHHLQRTRQHTKGGPILTVKHGPEPPELYRSAGEGMGLSCGY